MSGIDSRLRFRVYIDAGLIDEAWVDVRSPQRLQAVEAVWGRHQRLIDQAQADGKCWLIEIYDPAKPEEPALRFGTEQAGIPQPAADLAALLQQITARRPGAG